MVEENSSRSIGSESTRAKPGRSNVNVRDGRCGTWIS